jgi:hypothetical protein
MGGFELREYPRPLLRRGNLNMAAFSAHSAKLTRAADGKRLRDIARAVPVTHAMFHAHARHIERDRYK